VIDYLDYVGETIAILAKILDINVFVLGPRRVLWWSKEKGGMENDGVELGDKLGEPVRNGTSEGSTEGNTSAKLPIDKADALV
jgi:hypothetical protein